jgi:hypothetical protein
MAEAQGHAGDQFPRLSDEASHSSGLVPVHARNTSKRMSEGSSD